MSKKLIYLISFVLLLGLVSNAAGGYKASTPSPVDGETCVDPNVVLSWQAGDCLFRHAVYLGTDPVAVANAGTGDPEFKGYRNSGQETLDPDLAPMNPITLELCTTYYWRVDEIHTVVGCPITPPTMTVGDVWSFTTYCKWCHLKWSQPPIEWDPMSETPVYCGWDELSWREWIEPEPIWFDCWDCPTQCHGDADCNGVVDDDDMLILQASYMRTWPDPLYNPCADFNHDLTVNVLDLTMIQTNWMTNPPADCPGRQESWQIAADDFRCLGSMPITSIHWWGSHLWWDDPCEMPPDLPIAWRIGFWSNVPADPTVDPNYSHPEKLLWQIEVPADRVDVEEVGMDEYPEIPYYDICYQYYLDLEPDEIFWQNHYKTMDDIYWLSIAAIYDPCLVGRQFPWGWKTRPWSWMDDAVRFWMDENPVPGMVLDPGRNMIEPIEEPYFGESFDLAFELDTDPNYIKWEQPFTGIRDWPHYEDELSMATTKTVIATKWEQPPCLDDPCCMDVDATDDDWMWYAPQALADDFLCETTGLITDIHIWGSWLWDEPPYGDPNHVWFTLCIYSNDPCGPGDYSQPNKLLWTKEFHEGQFSVEIFAEGPEAYYIPCEPEYFSDSDWTCWLYSFYIDPCEAFVQEEGTIYWLALQAHIYDPYPWLRWRFGWKNSSEQWNDDAVWTVGTLAYDDSPWQELRHPMTEESVDLAFEITTEKEELHIDRLVADDWPCEHNEPVTDAVWWGSYIGYYYAACDIMGPWMPLPVKPKYFWLAIWDDVPAGAGITKWSQVADMDLGVDQYSVHVGNAVCSSDFECTDPNPVTAVRWWGSYLDGTDPGDGPNLKTFELVFHYDVPAGMQDPCSGEVLPYSHPTNHPYGDWLYYEHVTAEERYYGTTAGGEKVYEYIAEFNEPFDQEYWKNEPFNPVPGSGIFWLDIGYVDEVNDPPVIQWGWHESVDNRIDLSISNPSPSWHFSPWANVTVLDKDLAFEIITGEGPSYSHPNDIIWEYKAYDYDEVLVGYDKHSHDGGPVVFDGGAPDLVVAHEMTNWAQAEDFTLTVATTIESVRFWTVEAVAAWDGSCDYAIHTDASGAPGTLVDSGSVVLGRLSTGRTAFGKDEWENEFDLPAALHLSAGTYWLVLHMSSDCVARDEVYWETGSPGFGSKGLEDFECTGGPWSTNHNDHAFQLFGGGPGYEPVFRYSVRLPDPNWFCQEEPNNVYWFSVVAVYDANVPAVSVVVDDMESYDNAGNRIWDTWLDGIWNWTGSVVDLGIAPNDPVHGGNQSMVYYYENADLFFWGFDYYSEISATTAALGVSSDWAGLGVNKLVLWFYGDPNNDANDTEQMYVGLEDSSGNYGQVNYGNMSDIKERKWHLWCIDLQDFTGVDLTDVSELYIGFGIRGNPNAGGIPGGMGVVYFDDITLYDECPDEPSYNYPWGWTNHEHMYNDDAVAGVLEPNGEAPMWYWEELYDQNNMSEDMSFILFREHCFPDTDPKYNQWVLQGKPRCWCCEGQSLGDATGDGKTNVLDLFCVKKAYGKKWATDPHGTNPGEYNCCADFNHDGTVNVLDLFIVKQNYGQTVSPPCRADWVGDCASHPCP